MANPTNASNYSWSFEYYMDYLDPPPVDARKLKASRYSIVIAFWTGLASFVAFLFFILFYISQSGSSPVKNGGPQKRFPWNYSKTVQETVVSNHAIPTSIDNQVEEKEGICSNSRSPGRDDGRKASRSNLFLASKDAGTTALNGNVLTIMSSFKKNSITKKQLKYTAKNDPVKTPGVRNSFKPMGSQMLIKMLKGTVPRAEPCSSPLGKSANDEHSLSPILEHSD
ncbi:Melanocortin-2 receptor accessory protein 2A, partial [Varanus komodoensis]